MESSARNHPIKPPVIGYWIKRVEFTAGGTMLIAISLVAAGIPRFWLADDELFFWTLFFGWWLLVFFDCLAKIFLPPAGADSLTGLARLAHCRRYWHPVELLLGAWWLGLFLVCLFLAIAPAVIAKINHATEVEIEILLGAVLAYLSYIFFLLAMQSWFMRIKYWRLLPGRRWYVSTVVILAIVATYFVAPHFKPYG